MLYFWLMVWVTVGKANGMQGSMCEISVKFDRDCNATSLVELHRFRDVNSLHTCGDPNYLCVELPVGASYYAGFDETRAALSAAIDHVADTFLVNQNSQTRVVYLGLGASAVEWVVQVWVRPSEYQSTFARLVTSVNASMKRNRIPCVALSDCCPECS